MNNTGEPDRDPVRLGAPVCDITTGMWTVIGALAALQRRQQTGQGAVINASLMESGLTLLGGHFASMQATGQPPQRHPTGSPRVIVFQGFHTADGRIMITAATDGLFAKLCQGIGKPEWAQDARFRGNSGRAANKEEILGGIQEILAQRNTADWIAVLEPLGVPCAPINNLAQAVVDPQVEAMGIVQRARDLDGSFIGLPLSVDGERLPIRSRAPELGADDALLEAPDPWAAFGR